MEDIDLGSYWNNYINESVLSGKFSSKKEIILHALEVFEHNNKANENIEELRQKLLKARQGKMNKLDRDGLLKKIQNGEL